MRDRAHVCWTPEVRLCPFVPRLFLLRPAYFVKIEVTNVPSPIQSRAMTLYPLRGLLSLPNVALTSTNLNTLLLCPYSVFDFMKLSPYVITCADLLVPTS